MIDLNNCTIVDFFYSFQFIKSFRSFHSFWEKDNLSNQYICFFSFRVVQLTVQWHAQQNSYSISHLLGRVTTQWLDSVVTVYTPVHLLESVKVITFAWEWERQKLTTVHNSKLDAGVITNCSRNSKCAMHNVCVTTGCKTLSHTQSTVFYWLHEVNRSIVTVPSR